jgi:hypothetical protein
LGGVAEVSPSETGSRVKAGRQELYKIKPKIETFVEGYTETLEILWEYIPTRFTVQNNKNI